MTFNDDSDRDPEVPTVSDILSACRWNGRSSAEHDEFGPVRDYECHLDRIETLLFSLLETLTDDQKVALYGRIVGSGK